MAYSHLCEKCGYTAVDERPSYFQCPSCGVASRTVHTKLADNNYRPPYLYEHNCTKCGWSSPPTERGGLYCPNCGSSSVRTNRLTYSSTSSISSYSSSSSSSSSTSSSSTDKGAEILFLYVTVFTIGSMVTFWLMMPAWLIIWGLSSFIDFSIVGAWITALIITSLMVIVFYKWVNSQPSDIIEDKKVRKWMPLIMYGLLGVGSLILLFIISLIFNLSSFWQYTIQFAWWLKN